MLSTALVLLSPGAQVIVINGVIDGTESNGLLVSVPTVVDRRRSSRIGHVVYSALMARTSKASKYLIC
jgi:hypothetical protein